MSGYCRLFTPPVCLALLCASFSYAQNNPSTTGPKRLIADYDYWSRTQTPPYSADRIPFKKVTHINHAGVSFNADGILSVPDGFLEPALIHKAHAAGVKVILLLGGDFTGLETAAAGLSTLINNVQSFIAEHGYDGVDIDWGSIPAALWIEPRSSTS
jgi:GH18 family chitinase